MTQRTKSQMTLCPLSCLSPIFVLGNFSLPIQANEGAEERLNVSLSRNEGRAVPCSTVVKEGWGEGLRPLRGSGGLAPTSPPSPAFPCR